MLAWRTRFRSAGRFVRVAVLAVAIFAMAAAIGCRDSRKSDDKGGRQSDRRGSVQRNGDDYNYPRVLLRARSGAEALRDRAELVGLLRALRTYAESHSVGYPPSLDALAEDDPSVRKMLSYKDGQKRLEYVAGLSHRSRGDSVIVYEATADRDEKRFVGRIDGTVELLDEEQFAVAMKR